MARKTGPTKQQAETVIERSEGVCEYPGCVAPGAQLHHRRPRGIGGTRDPLINSPANIVNICYPHHALVEQFRVASQERGFLISRLSALTADQVPLLYRDGRWVLLHDDGGIEQLSDSELFQ